jgi:hypothetical protein
MPKKIITETICKFDIWELDGCDRKTAHENIDAVFDFAEETHHDIHINIDISGYDGYNDSSLSGKREETDAERKKRLDLAQKAREKKAAEKEKHRAKIEKEARKLGLITE